MSAWEISKKCIQLLTTIQPYSAAKLKQLLVNQPPYKMFSYESKIQFLLTIVNWNTYALLQNWIDPVLSES